MTETKRPSADEMATLRKETLQTLAEDRDAWRATAAPQSNVLVGERMIVVDRHERGYSSFEHEGKQREGLTQVPRDMHGVIKFTPEGAARVQARLEKEAPEFVPYTVWDFQQYAASQADRSQKLIDDLTSRARTADGPAVIPAEAVGVIEYKLKVSGASAAPEGLSRAFVRGMASGYQHSLEMIASSPAKKGGPTTLNAEGVTVIEKALQVAVVGDPSEAPFPLVGGEAKDYLRGLAQAYRESLKALAGVDVPEAGPGFLLLEITNTSNAAFVDVGRDEEIARIIREAAEYTWPSDLSSIKRTLYDLNGNRVGELSHVADAPAGEPSEGAVRLAIKSDAVSPDSDAGIALARVLKDVASKVARGEHSFSIRGDNAQPIAVFEFHEPPTYVNDGVLNIAEAMKSGDVYMADDGFSGLAEGEFRYVVPGPEFMPGYHQGSGEAWLVNAKGEIAPGYEDMRTVRELDFKKLTREESAALSAVVEGRVSFEDHERTFGGDEIEPD